MVGKNLMCEDVLIFGAQFASSINSPKYPDRDISQSQGILIIMSPLMQPSGKTTTETNMVFITSLIQPPIFTLPFHIDNKLQKLSLKRSIKPGSGGLDHLSQ